MVADDVAAFAGLKLEEVAVRCELLDGPPPLAYAGDVIRTSKAEILIMCNMTASTTVKQITTRIEKCDVRFGSRVDGALARTF